MAEATFTNKGSFNTNIWVRILTSTTLQTINFSFLNPSNRYLRLSLEVEGTPIFTQDLGLVTSYNYVATATHVDDILQAWTVNTGATDEAEWTLRSYTDATYTTQDGSDVNELASVFIPNLIETSLAPTFTTADLINVDKNVEVRDSYNNLLITSSTETLIGSTDPIVINGISKIMATITVANKAVAILYTDMSVYWYGSGAISEPYSDIADVELIRDNINTPNANIVAVDQRQVRRVLNIPYDAFVTHVPVSISGLSFERDNLVETTTKMIFSGQLWNKYFDTGTTSGSGVLNDIVVEYRYKETAEAWGAQSWTDVTSNVTVDSEGVVSFEEYINGDLAGDGFDAQKSFDVEVRAYDRLSAIIIEGSIDVGIPLIDYYSVDGQKGIAINKLYDPEVGGALQVEGKAFVSDNVSSPNIDSGWNNPEVEASYVGVDAPSYELSIIGDHCKEFSIGSKIRLKQYDSNLSAYYKFNTGALTTDDSGNANTLTAISDPAEVAGKYGTGASLDGNDAYSVSTNDDDFLATGSLTIGIWVKTSTSGVTQGLYQAYSNASNNRAGIQLYINSSNKAVMKSGGFGSVQGTNWQEIAGATSITDGKWHFIVGTYVDGVGLRIYVDGQLDGSIAWTVDPVYSTPVVGNTYIRFGCLSDTGTNASFLTGIIDEAFFLKGTALTEGEIYALFFENEELSISSGDMGIIRCFGVNKVDYDGTSTNLVVYGGTEFVLQNLDIFDLWYSRQKAPVGFPVDPDKWTVETLGTSNSSQSPATTNTFYNLGSLNIVVPIGVWELEYFTNFFMSKGSAINLTADMALSTSTSSISDAELQSGYQKSDGTTDANSTIRFIIPTTRNKIVKLATKTTYYLIARITLAGDGNLAFDGSRGTTRIRATWAYL